MNSSPSAPRIRSLSARSLALLACAASAYLGACSKDEGATGPDPKPGKTNPPTPRLETSSLYGRITDEGGAALAGVKVAAGSASATTDANGLFRLDHAKVPEGRAVITASKDGYYDGARAEIPGSGGRTRFELKLMKKEFSHSVPAADGGKVEVKDGATVTFAGGSFVTASGSAYTGTVKVAARYLDPDSASFYDFFAGDNQGWGADAEFAALVSLGVLRVDIRGSGGQALKLADGKPASLTYPKASTVSGPDKIPLWYFDAEIGQWREEGSATLKDGVYVGEVSHFSDWNLDYKGGETWAYCVNITCGGKPVAGVKVRTFQKIGISDSAGGLCFVNAPADTPTNTVEILAVDNGGDVFMDGPTAINVVKGARERPTFPLELDSECPGTVDGVVVGCGGDPIEAMVSVKGKGGFSYAATENGRFQLPLSTDSGLVLHAQDGAGNSLVPSLALRPLAAGERRDLGEMKICSTGTSNFTDISLESEDNLWGWGISPDASLLAYHFTGLLTHKLTLMDAKTKQIRGTAEQTPDSYRIAFSRDNSRMLTQDGDSVVLFDVTAGSFKRLSVIRPIVYAEFTADNKSLFGVSRQSVRTTVSFYDIETGAPRDTLHPTNFSMASVTDKAPEIKLLTEDSAFLYLVSGGGGSFRLWSTSGDTLIREIKTGIPHASIGHEIVHSATGRTFSICPDRYTVTVFETLTGNKVRSFDVRDFGGVADGYYGEYTVPGGSLSEAYYFRQAKVAGVGVIQLIDFRDSALAAVLPTPKVKVPVSYPLQVHPEGKIVSTRFRLPSKADSTKSVTGFRIYKLD